MKNALSTSSVLILMLGLFLFGSCFPAEYMSASDKTKPRSELCALIIGVGCTGKPYKLHSINGRRFNNNTAILYAAPGKYSVEYVYSDIAIVQKKTTHYFGKPDQTKYVTRVNKETLMRNTYAFEKSYIYTWDCEKGFVYSGKKIPNKK